MALCMLGAEGACITDKWDVSGAVRNTSVWTFRGVGLWICTHGLLRPPLTALMHNDGI